MTRPVLNGEIARLACSQLDHVLLALRDNDRSYNIRDVLDPWWCYERGLPFTRTQRGGGWTVDQFNKPCAWEERTRLPKFDWISTGAQAIIAQGEQARILNRRTHPPELTLVVDHAVPPKATKQALFANRLSWDGAKPHSFLAHHYKRAVLCSAENRALTGMGYKSSMPDGWSIGGDPYARYDAIGLKPFAC